MLGPRRIRAAVMAGVLGLSACGQAPGPPPAADAIPPPANLDPTLTRGPKTPAWHPASAGPHSWDGSYAGEGYLTLDPGGQMSCPGRIPVSGMTVSNGRVSFHGFQGTIGPDGTTRLVYGEAWVLGRFANGGFEGNLVPPFPDCNYTLRLSKVPSPAASG